MEEEQLVQQDLELDVGVYGIAGYGQVGFAGTVVALECRVEDELGLDQFNRPDLCLLKILQEQFIP